MERRLQSALWTAGFSRQSIICTMHKFLQFLKKFFSITIPAMIVLLLICEFIIFRWVLPASDWPYRSTIQGPDDVVRYVYKDSGMYREGRFRQGFPNEIEGTYRINREGWNSHREYLEQRSGKMRIAVIGDSFVDAHQVKVEDAFPSILEKDLLAKGCDVEVYRFGFGAAPLSQYLQMMRYVKKKFDPDLFVINILPNDYLVSMYGYGNWDKDFLQIRREGDQWVEVKPRPYKPSRGRMLLKKSATFRYLYQNLSLKDGLPSFAELFKRQSLEEEFQMNINVKEAVKDLELIRSIARYLFSKLLQELPENRKLLLVMDANRHAIYAGKDPRKEKVDSVMSAVAEEAEDLAIPGLDLTDVFLSDFRRHHERFEFPHDYHWNSRGHALVGKSIADFFLRNDWCKQWSADFI